MKWSLYIGKPAGIKVFIHWTFILLVIWLSWMHLQQGHGLFEIIMGLIFLTALFACVTLHEFGHALAARRYGIGTLDINLLPIGGVARLESMPEDPKEELVVAIAGPAVNVAIAAGLYLIMLVLGQTDMELGPQITGSNFLADQLVINIILVLFNLIPAFPMDGGRVLRALLAFKIKRDRATRIAASVGQLLAIGFVFFGLFYNPWLLFIGIFVFLGAGAEARQVSMAESVKHLTAKDIIKGTYPSISLSATVGQAASVFLENPASEVVIANGDRFEGLISHASIIKALQEGKSAHSVVEIIREEVQTVPPDITFLDLISAIQTDTQTVYPVVQQGKLLGVITEHDLNEIIRKRQTLSASIEE
jgi:Zn-dependent protease/CBS domain-containing protein